MTIMDCDFSLQFIDALGILIKDGTKSLYDLIFTLIFTIWIVIHIPIL